MSKITTKGIPLILSLIALLFLAYVLFPDFRCLLENLNIDPNYLIVFLTSMALLLGILQASKDRRIAYNSSAILSLEDKGLRIIGKLLTIFNKSNAFNLSLIHLDDAIRIRSEFKDLNNLLDKSDVDTDLELIGAYVDVYYPDLSLTWNSLWDDLNKIANNFSSTYINYEANKEDLLNGVILNVKELNDLPQKLTESAAIHVKISSGTQDMRNKIIESLNTHKTSLVGSIKNGL